VLGRILECVRRATEDFRGGELLATGVAAPGPLDPATGFVMSPPNLPGWDNVPLADIISDAVGVKVSVNNDANLAGLAEFRFGAGSGAQNLIYLTVSTGVGGGIICDGRLLSGAHGLAGEPGHMTVDPGGIPCACGNVGCLETLASGTALARRAQTRLQSGEASLLSERAERGALTAEDVGIAAHSGDRLALQVVAEGMHFLGIGVLNLIHLFDPDLVVIGGGVTNLGPLLFDPVQQWVHAHAMTQVQRLVPIVPASLGDRVGLMGAVAWALQCVD